MKRYTTKHKSIRRYNSLTQAIIIFIAVFIGYKLFEILSFVLEGGTFSMLMSDFSMYSKEHLMVELTYLMLINTIPLLFLLYPFTDKNRHEYKLRTIIAFIFVNIIGTGVVAYKSIFMPHELSIINRGYEIGLSVNSEFDFWTILLISLLWIIINAAMILFYRWLIYNSKNINTFRSHNLSFFMSTILFLGFIALVSYSIYMLI